jgi:hypothetical protein
MAASGNFCTLNPLAALGGGTPDFGTLSDGNTTVALGDTAFGNIGVTSGKWYWEFVITSSSPSGQAVGWANEQVNSGAELGYNSPSSQTGAQIVYMYLDKNPPEIISDAPKAASSGTDVDLAQTIAQYDIVGIAADFDNDKWYMSIDGSFTDMRSGQNPADGSNPLCSKTGEGGLVTIARTAGYVWYPAVGNWAASARTFKVNFGQDSTFGGQSSLPGTNANAADENGYGDFYYTPPSGFLALCTANLSISENIDPAQTSTNYPAKNFNVVTWSGNSTDDTTISGVGFQSDFIWSKAKNTTESWNVVDTSRGVAASRLKSDSDAAQSTSTDATGGCKSVNSDGFVLGTQTNWNSSSNTYVGYCWKANGGTTTSFSASGDQLAGTYQANTDSKFSIITYTGSGSADSEVLHGLGTTPNFIIWKDRGATYWWGVYLKSGGTVHTGDSSLLYLNSANALASNQQVNIVPDSTKIVFSGNEQINKNTNTYVMYAWADNEMQKFGMYEGNGNADGPFVYTGFRPRMLILKDLDDAENWVMFDSERNTYNPIDNGVFPNATTAETTGSGSGFDVDFLATGFKLRCTHDNMNGSSTYVYACWGDVPFKYNNTF